MTTATPTTTAPTTTVARGFGPIPCPCCGEANALIVLELNDTAASDAFACRECDGSFGLDDVRGFIAKWSKVLAWIDLAPAIGE